MIYFLKKDLLYFYLCECVLGGGGGGGWVGGADNRDQKKVLDSLALEF